MLFNSVIFITLFLPLCLLGWYGLQKLKNPIYAKLFLVLMSFWFYGYYNPWYLILLIGSIAINFSFSKLFQVYQTGKKRKVFLWLGILFNVGVLFYFKYFNFFLDNCNFLFHGDFQIEKIALPLGISFFTFQQISFVVDRYKEKAPSYKLIDYACFVAFFPQLIAGPIVLHSEFIPQLLERKNNKPDWDKFYDGFALFILGLGKKVLLADVLAIPVNEVFHNIAIIPYYLDMPTAWIVMICYILELYFDFSGYCDMARGIGLLFGFTLPVNFNAPLKATSVKELWRRWHMTLTRFLSTYIYFPLGGSKKGVPRQCINLLIVFFVSGLWHGANWTFVLWGVASGLALVWETLFPKLRFRFEKINWFFTQVFFLLSLVLFRSDSLTTALQYYKKMFAGGVSKYIFSLGSKFEISETFAIMKFLKLQFPSYVPIFGLISMGVFLVAGLLLAKGPLAEEWIAKKGRTKKGIFVLATLFTWGVVSLSQVSTFLYFNF